VKKSSIIAAVVLIGLVTAVYIWAPSPTDEGVEDQLGEDETRTHLATGLGAFLTFLLGFGIRDALGQRAQRAGRRAPMGPEDP